MLVKDISSIDDFKMIIEGDSADREISGMYCCDLLSVAMGNAPEGSAWCTVMANMNTLAVASLADCACVILCCNAACDENMQMKAKAQGITIFSTSLPVFEAALAVHERL